MQPRNVAFFYLFLEDAPLHGDILDVDHHFSGPGRLLRVKHLVTQPLNAQRARPSHLTTADEVYKVSTKDSPSKTAKAGYFEACRP